MKHARGRCCGDKPRKESELAARDVATQFWVETSAPALEGRLAAQYSLSNGHLGLRGTHEEMPAWASPGFHVAGTYSPAPREQLFGIHPPDHILTHPERVKPEHHAKYRELTTLPNLPNPVAVKLAIGDEVIDLAKVTIKSCERVMHMNEARLTRRLVIRDSAGRRTVVDSERFVSWANPKLLAFRYRVMPDGYTDAVEVAPYFHTDVANGRGAKLFEVGEKRENVQPFDFAQGRHPTSNVQHRSAAQQCGANAITVKYGRPEQRLSVVQAYETRKEKGAVVLDVVVAVAEREEDAMAAAKAGLKDGYDALLEAHVAAVEEFHQRVQVKADADILTRQGLNFGLMHLEMALCKDNPNVSVPIKGLTGEGYRFMIFWDTDFHMFPYYLLTNPKQARNLILYRYKLLDAARANAKKDGYRGAQVPWETATTGEEETAPWLNLAERELHMSADVAYAVKQYDELADDPGLLVDFGAEIVFETARFYASRVVRNAAADRYELRDIGCPDQYHTFADNNVFISRMAKWNLAYAVELAGDERLKKVRNKVGLTDREVAEMRKIADKLYVIPPNEQGIIEEFDGFFKLSTDLRGINELFCSHTQAVKQPDVLALFLPFADEISLAVMATNWRFYEARTMHGSSLSLPGMALAAALAGLTDEAADCFQRAARVDLDDRNLNANMGVHLAGYGVLWQTLAFGFGGLTPRRERLDFNPRLPACWKGLSFAVSWRGQRVVVELDRQVLRVTADRRNKGSAPVCFRGGDVEPLGAGKSVAFGLR